ncbi:MAG: nuclear transport factor 2 family protein, partial [Microthrixaceae bacterium]
PEARGRHATSSTVLDLDAAAGTGSGWVDYVFFDSGGAATNIGRYHDHYVRGDDGRWLFSLREIVFLNGEPELADPWS